MKGIVGMMQNKKNIIIGITGGIACGKSTVSKILKKQYFEHIDADIIAKQVVEKGKPAYLEIIDFFGKDILLDNEEVDRKKLAEVVFSDNKKLQELNKITHKYVYCEIEKLIKQYDEIQKNIVVDAILLYEGKLDKLVDEVWYIESEEKIRLNRVIIRNNYTIEQAQSRIDSQQVYKNKEKADIIIYNNDEEEVLEREILDILKNKNII